MAEVSDAGGFVKPRSLAMAGWVGLALTLVSVVDIVRPRPFDGVILDEAQPKALEVREVLPGSGAQEAGIRPNDTILGIDRTILKSASHAATILSQRSVGDQVPYLVRGVDGMREVSVRMGPRRLVTAPYVYACLLGFSFFFVGSFVLQRQPRRRAAQLFYLLCVLFMLFLVLRLRPLSYARLDALFLELGTLALVWLPACFLHFFLIFPRRAIPDTHRGERNHVIWLAVLSAVYAIPALILAAAVVLGRTEGVSIGLVSGAPLANWWVLAIYMVTGLGVLLWNTLRLKSRRERRGAYLVLFGSLFGLLPFLTTAVAFPALLHTERFLWLGVFPLALVPLTFAYAIVVFRMLDVQVILRRSVLYTVTTAIITGIYVLGIVAVSVLTSSPGVIRSVWVPPLLALAIVFLFEPLRRRVQAVVERYFYADRRRIEEAIAEIETAFAREVDLQPVVHGLVEQLPQRLELEFSGLYLERIAADNEPKLVRTAGPTRLPAILPPVAGLERTLAARRGVVSLSELEAHLDEHPVLRTWVEELAPAGVRVICLLSSPRRRVGLMVLSDKVTQMVFEEGELDALRRLTSQAAIALETNLLLEERMAQAEMERELAIAAEVQQGLLSARVDLGPGWEVVTHCNPARKVGGDFFTQLPGPSPEARALAYGDVAGKSIAGALMMMAAHEVLHSLALTERSPVRLFELANQRLYALGKRRSFVALAYLAATRAGRIDYVLAGQPEPLLLRSDGSLSELAPPRHRIPLGGLADGGDYRVRSAELAAGDVLLCYSDGVTEAVSPSGEFFGLERVKRVLEELDGAGPQHLVRELIAAIDVFTEGAEPYDDITVIALKRRDRPS